MQVAVETSSIGQFKRDASPRRLPQFSKREVVRLLSHRNVFRLAAAWPRRGVLAYERGGGGLCGIRFLVEMC